MPWGMEVGLLPSEGRRASTPPPGKAQEEVPDKREEYKSRGHPAPPGLRAAARLCEAGVQGRPGRVPRPPPLLLGRCIPWARSSKQPGVLTAPEGRGGSSPDPNTEGSRHSVCPRLLSGGCFSLDSENSCSLQLPVLVSCAHAWLLGSGDEGVQGALGPEHLALETTLPLGPPAEWVPEMTSEDTAPLT